MPRVDEWCLNHLDYAGETCPECGLEVDGYGNTEVQLEYCCSPDCGCPESRLCMASQTRNGHEYALQKQTRKDTLADAGFGAYLKDYTPKPDAQPAAEPPARSGEEAEG